MIVCHCKGITDRDLCRPGNGEGGTGRTPAHTEAGTACGGCLPVVRALLEGSKQPPATEAGVQPPRR